MSDFVTIELKRGDTFEYVWELEDEEKGEPYPLADIYFRSQIKNKAKKTVHSMDSGTLGGITVDESTSSVKISVPPEVTETLLVQKYYTDLELTFPTGFRISTDTVIIDVEEDQTT